MALTLAHMLADVNVRTFYNLGAGHWPAATLYVSPLPGDPRTEEFVNWSIRRGLPGTFATDNDGKGGAVYTVRPAGPRWRLTLDGRRVEVWTRKGELLAVVEHSSAPERWFELARLHGEALVAVGAPMPFADDAPLREVVDWLCTHYTASGLVPVGRWHDPAPVMDEREAVPYSARWAPAAPVMPHPKVLDGPYTRAHLPQR